MPEHSDANPGAVEPPAREPSEVFDELSEVVRRAMLEVAQLHEIQQRVTALSERIAKLTPLPTKAPEQQQQQQQ